MFESGVAGREPQPSAGIIDSQSVKAADTVAGDSRGYNAGKRINGGKRFIVMAASWRDRDDAKTTLLSTYLATPIRHAFADQGFAGRFVDRAATRLHMTVEIVRKPAEQRGLPTRGPTALVAPRTRGHDEGEPTGTVVKASGGDVVTWRGWIRRGRSPSRRRARGAPAGGSARAAPGEAASFPESPHRPPEPGPGRD